MKRNEEDQNKRDKSGTQQTASKRICLNDNFSNNQIKSTDEMTTNSGT